jgi:2-polyprenyl-3-methyl-5-hydroxy-6-metoxy-1,4-benzoquinol methylase
MAVDPVRFALNRAYEFCDEQQRALDEGRITEAEWFDIHKRFFTSHYLAADNPRAQSGHSGDEAVYRYTRGMLLEAVHRDGTLLDVGCANGHLIEMLGRWLEGTGLAVEFYGLDISEGLLDLAKSRLPHWHDRFLLGNALFWTPPQPFDFVVMAELAYVPRQRRRELLDRLWSDYVAPGGRLILGPYGELREQSAIERIVRAWGHSPTGYCEKSHLTRPELCKRLLWFDKA